MDLIDDEAEVGTTDEEEEMETENSRSGSIKKKKQRAISSDEDEDEDDDEEKAREEMRGFIADDDDENEESGGGNDDSDGEMRRKKKKKRPRERVKSRSDEEEDIDDEDRELLKENLGITIAKKRKRIRMESGSEESQSEAEAGERDEIPDFEGQGEESGNDSDGFIVDANGQPLRTERKRKKTHIFDDKNLQAAEDIFGVNFDFGEFGQYGDDDDDQEDYEEDEDDDEETSVRKRRRQRKIKTIYETYEPAELEKRHYTDKDNEIRNTDLPERMQLRAFPVTPPDDPDEELQREAEWIFAKITKSTVSSQEMMNEREIGNWTRNKENYIEKIRNALEHIRLKYFEVPYINNYCKEYVQPELKINDLWRVYKLDEEFCKLHKGKKNLGELFNQTKEFQTQQIFSDPEAPIPEDVRLVNEYDLQRIEDISTFEELKDMQELFRFYYKKDLVEIKAMMLKKKKEAKEAKKAMRQNKKEKKKKTKTIINEEGDEVEVTDDEAEEEEDEPEDVEDDDDDEDIDEDILKGASGSDPYSLCRKLGITLMAEEIGLKSSEFGENLQDGYQKVDVRKNDKEPLKLAQEFAERYAEKNPKATSLKPEEILEHVKRLHAKQISLDPKVRATVREAYYERARVNVRPTKNKGLRDIDESHDCFTLKYLTDKPVNSFTGDQWLKLVEAEKQKMITIEFSKDIVSFTKGKTFLQDAQKLYHYDAYSKLVQEWNNIRKECVEIAFSKILYPMLRKELRHRLTREAKDGVINSCRSVLYDWLKVGRFNIDFEEEDEDDWGTKEGCRIMAVMYENDLNIAAYAVIITTEGEVASYLKLEHILKRKNSWNEAEREAKESDMDLLSKFILKNRPHCIVVGSADRMALAIKEDVEFVVSDLINQEQFPKIKVTLMNDNLAKVYANSSRAEQDFSEFPKVLKEAVSLARRMQDPLIEFSQLTGPEKEILCLRYNPLQDLLSEDELLEGLYLEFINRVCEVGVDINQCVTHDHMSNLVQFVSGLGPRKGAALLKTLRQMKSSQRLENRNQLVLQCHMGPNIYVNCAGFIRINTAALGDSDTYVEILDGSRIHPEAYDWAKKMAVDALEMDEDEGNPANALEEILQVPEKLSELDLEAFAAELERQGYGKKLNTLYDIRSELHDMYKDFREAFVDPSHEEIFNMVTKESPQTFYVGRLVMATVTGFAYKKPQGEELDKAVALRKGEGNNWQCPFCGQDDFPELTEVWNHFDAGTCPGKAVGVKIRLDNGVSGFIPIKNLSDSAVTNPEERVQRNQSIYCRIVKINPERFNIEAICKSSALDDKDNEWKPRKDNYYDYDAESDEKQQHDSQRKKAQAKQSYVKRVIVHPNFKNIDFKRAERILDNKEKDKSDAETTEYSQGDVIIRPSSKGEDHLTVTWKVTWDGIHQHIDVLEKNKINAFSLGQSLWIGTEEFEDLDEIIARHITPMASHARDLLNFKYYKDTDGGKRDVAEKMLKQDKQAHPGKIHYFVSASKELPGKFMLSYMPRHKARHEYITVLPDGFRFRQQTFDSLSSLFKWFKEHFRDPIPGTPVTTPRTGGNTQRTPYMTGTPGGITPGAMSMAAAATPYGGTTPAGGGYNINTPYTPSGQTPILTPYNTPGPSNTPRGHHMAPPPIPTGTPGGMPPPPPQRRSYHQPSPGGYGRSPAGGRPREDSWQSAMDGWARGGRSNRGSNTPKGYPGGNTPQQGSARGTPMSGQNTPRRTPRGQFDSTPLYDE